MLGTAPSPHRRNLESTAVVLLLILCTNPVGRKPVCYGIIGEAAARDRMFAIFSTNQSGKGYWRSLRLSLTMPSLSPGSRTRWRSTKGWNRIGKPRRHQVRHRGVVSVLIRHDNNSFVPLCGPYTSVHREHKSSDERVPVTCASRSLV